MFNVSERTARGHLNELVKLDLIKPVGPQKGRYYVLAWPIAGKLPRKGEQPMNKLSKEEIAFITKCLKEGKSLPESCRYIIPFETKKEYELTYEGKERDKDILADTMAAPLQPVETFGGGYGGWTNKLIFGDNLQVLYVRGTYGK